MFLTICFYLYLSVHIYRCGAMIIISEIDNHLHFNRLTKMLTKQFEKFQKKLMD